MSKHLYLLLLLLAALATARENPGNWTEVRSPSFTVITNSGEKQGRRIAAQFERMRAIFQVLYPDLETDPDTPIVVLAPKNKEEFRALEPSTYLPKGSLKLHGLFVRASHKNYILMRLDPEGGNPYPVVYHEYTHLVLSEAGDEMPLWLNEGLAEFYENTEIYDQEVLLGGLNLQRLRLLREHKLLPLETLFTVDEKSSYYTRENTGSVFHAESWALTRYLTLKDYEERTSRVREYTKLVNDNVDPVVAAIRAFGDLKSLQRALDRYIEHPSFDHFNTKVARVDDSAFQIESISPAQAEAVQADFLACNGRATEARALLQHVLQQDASNELAHETMAFLQAADEADAESKLRAAIQLDPSSATACDRLASFLWERGKNLHEAQALEARAVSLDGGNVGYRINLASILLRLGETHSAVEVLRAATASAKTPQEAESAGRLLSQAVASVSGEIPDKNQQQQADTVAAQPVPYRDHEMMARGPHVLTIGILKAVHCEPPNLDLSVTSRMKLVKLHTDNYYKVRFSALFKLTGDLNPCNDLENRRAKIEYVEAADSSDPAQLIAVELLK